MSGFCSGFLKKFCLSLDPFKRYDQSRPENVFYYDQQRNVYSQDKYKDFYTF